MPRLSDFGVSAALALTVVLGMGAFACAKTSSDDDPGAIADTDAGGGTTPEGGFGGDAEPYDAQASCNTDAEDVFVVTDDKTLYSFHPPTVTFTAKGTIDCPTGGATPTSMAVDRSGIAWVRHSDGSVWKVDTQTLQCTQTAFAPPGTSFSKFGMGFSTTTAGGSAEALYLADSGGTGIATLDTSTFQLTYIGPYTGDFAGRASELTGTGDGRLFGFFTTSPAQIAQIDKTTGDVIAGSAVPLTGVSAGDAWAFSFYAGDFYVYTDNSPDNSSLPESQTGSSVTRYSPSDGSITVVKAATGFRIVGAGVSTCAPTTIVK